MGTQVTLVYKIAAVGTTIANLFPFVSSAPIPPEVLQAFGLRVLSDGTTAANPLIRTIVLGFDPSMTALINPLEVTSTGHIQSAVVDVVNSGLDYILPPFVRADNNARSEPLFKIADGVKVNLRSTQSDAILQAYMACYGAKIVDGGGGYGLFPVDVAFLGGLPPAGFDFDFRKVDPTTETSVPRNFRGGCVRYINIANPGRGYPIDSQLSIQGGGPTGIPAIEAKGILTLDAKGSVKSIAIMNMGSGYVSVPQVVITSPSGTQPKEVAKLFAVMAEGRPAQGFATVALAAVTAVTVTDPGDNYVTVPTISIVEQVNLNASAVADGRMGLGRIDVIAPGAAYLPGTTATATPAFQNYFPTVPGDPQAQAAMFFKFLQGAIQQIAITPLTSDPPLVA